MSKSKKQIIPRVIAGFVDYTIIFLVCFFYVQTFGEVDSEGSNSVSGLKTIPIFIFWIAYFCGSELVFGKTLGNYFLNLKPVDYNSGKNINFKQSFLRHLVDPFDMFFFGLIGILIIYNSKENQRLGDLIAKTKVIKT